MGTVFRMQLSILLVSLLVLGLVHAENKRKPKLFYVSTTSTTTTLSAFSLCFMTTTSFSSSACGKRKRRAAVAGPSDTDDLENLLKPSMRIESEEDLPQGLAKSNVERNGKYLLYWMTTTSISTLTTFTETRTIASLYCTPTSFKGTICGRRKKRDLEEAEE